MDWEFGSYRLKRAERLLIGPEGPLELSARSFDILDTLLRKPDEVVGKGELFDTVWPGLAVEENTLQVHISALRKALPQGMIVTVHGRGYKYAGPKPFVPAAESQEKRRPSIAVLPFTNMSGDPEQEYFSDGITEDIITELSRFRSLFVIARNSSFQYKGQNVDVRRVAQDLGVQYALEGSVRKTGDRIRISAQLIDCVTGNHLWSERFDRALIDVFAVQDEVLQGVVARAEGRLVASVAEQARRKPTEHLAAYDLVLQARNFLNTYDAAYAEPLLRRAISLDPNYAQAWALLADVACVKFFSGPPNIPLDDALMFGRKAVALDPNDSLSHWTIAEVHLFRLEFEEAGASFDRALALNPNDTLAIAMRAFWLSAIGRCEEAIVQFDLVLERDPFPPNWYWDARVHPLMALKRYDEAVQSFRRMDRLFFWTYASLAACYAMLEETEKAKAAVAEALRMKPDLRIQDLLHQEPHRNAMDRENYINSLRKAGLPA
jgi:TolB-like protein